MMSTCLLAAYLSCYHKNSFILPGGVLVSVGGSDELVYSDGMNVHRLRIERPPGVGRVFATQVGADGNIYVMLYANIMQTGGPVGSVLERVNQDGSTSRMFDLSKGEILDFGVTRNGFVVLIRGSGDAKVLWIHRDGISFKEVPAPYFATRLAAGQDDDNVILSASHDSEAPRLFLLRKDHFDDLGDGSKATWINAEQFMYEDTGRCIREMTLGRATSITVLCDELFAGAASPDARFVAVTVLTSKGMKDRHELRVIDTSTGGRYVTILEYGPEAIRVSWMGAGPLLRPWRAALDKSRVPQVRAPVLGANLGDTLPQFTERCSLIPCLAVFGVFRNPDSPTL